MTVEDLIRSGLRDAADQTPPINDLHVTAVQRGRRRRTARRVSTAGGVALSVAAIAGAGVVVAGNTGGGGQHAVTPASQPSQQVIADPWWQTWTTGRHDGAVDPQFLAAARPTYDTAVGPEQIKTWADGTTSDGTQWVLFSDQSHPHMLQWLQGWDGQPDYGESSQQATPDITWTSWTTPTLATHDGTTDTQEWLIVVGRPGTTEIDYSPDGTTWQPMDIQQGIAVMKITTATGFPPAAAKVRLSDSTGVYATGVPAGAGAGDTSSDATGGMTGTPTATPTSGSISAPSAG